jgi:uncharacterized protein DUF695
MRRITRSFLTALSLLLAATLCQAQEDPNYQYTYTRSPTEGPTTTMVAKPALIQARQAAYPWAVVVLWGYVPAGKGSADEFKLELGRAADAVEAQLNSRPESVVAAFKRGGTSTAWIIYAEKGLEFSEELAALTKKLPHSRWKVNVIGDAEWKLLEKFVKEQGIKR